MADPVTAGGDHRQGPKPRPLWRSVAVPTEHGGWGLTFEAVLLGLLVRPSTGGVAIGVAAFAAFVARTPLKLAVVDRRRRRRLDRSVLAERIAGVELAVLVAAVVVAALTAQRWWWVPLVSAVPFFALELSFDVRSRSRRLAPELSGAVGMGAVASAIALAGGLRSSLAVGLWVVLAARAVGSVPFARTQVRRLRHQVDHRRLADAGQMAAVGVVLIGWALGWVLWSGATAVGVLAGWNLLALRLPVRSAKRVGILQLMAGVAVVVATAIGVRLA
ncbi:MAG TPA: YwiC-like family protein [Acidimicrobiales bacterium]|nr:YwiC-like family protein [Acidimicrobiales bacterium]